jgi:hypothetical protein
MKPKFIWTALLASAALIAQAHAGGHHGGGEGFAGGSGSAPPAPARASGVSSVHSMPMQNFGGGRMIYSGQRFSSVGLRSPSSGAFRPHYINSNKGASIGTRQFTPRNINRDDRVARFSNGGNHTITNPGRERNGAGQIRNGNNLPANWRNHVVAQRSANWHRDWDRRRDHTWHGHHCRFINGSWVIFDFGFYPWWPYWYPYDYYAYDYYPYPYRYDPGYYESDVYQGEEYYGQNSYGYADQYIDSTVAAAQERLAQQGYYRGQIDGIFGPETRRAVARYQSNHGLRVTGYLTTDTLRDLGLRRS